MSSAIPSDWSIKTVDEIATVFAGGTPSRNRPEFFEGKIPWVKSGEVNSRFIFNTEENISELAVKESSARWAKAGSVLVAMYGATAGKSAKLMIDATLNQAVSAINGKPGYAENDFLIYAIGNRTPELLNTVQGSGQPNLSGFLIKNLDLPIPPLIEQQKIATILSSVDDVIEKTRTQIDKLKYLKTGMMQELLTQGIGHKEFKDSPVGKIPEIWEIENLINLSSNGISNGVFNDPKKVGSGYKIINVYDMYRGFGVDVSSLKLVNIDQEEFLRNKVHYGDVFFTRSSLKLEGIAYCNINLSHENDLTYDGHLMRVRPDQNRVNPKYLAYFCLSNHARKFFMSSAKHSTMTTIGQADIAPLMVLLPPLEEQEKIVSLIDSVESKINVTNGKLSAFNNVKKALMQDLLTGKVRVNVENHQEERMAV